VISRRTLSQCPYAKGVLVIFPVAPLKDLKVLIRPERDLMPTNFDAVMDHRYNGRRDANDLDRVFTNA